MPKISVLTPTIREGGLVVVGKSLREQTFQDFEWLVEVNTSGKVDFNKAMNNMLGRAGGELIVSLQDFISIPTDGLEKFWEAHKKDSKFYTAPVGKIKGEDVAWDWRIEREDINWVEWEIDWGSCPKDKLIEIGGFDEELDKYWGFDNVNVGKRAQLAGYKFGCLPDNKAVAIDHDGIIEHPFRKLRNPDFHNKRLDEFEHGLKLEFSV